MDFGFHHLGASHGAESPLGSQNLLQACSGWLQMYQSSGGKLAKLQPHLGRVLSFQRQNGNAPCYPRDMPRGRQPQPGYNPGLLQGERGSSPLILRPLNVGSKAWVGVDFQGAAHRRSTSHAPNLRSFEASRVATPEPRHPTHLSSRWRELVRMTSLHLGTACLAPAQRCSAVTSQWGWILWCLAESFPPRPHVSACQPIWTMLFGEVDSPQTAPGPCWRPTVWTALVGSLSIRRAPCCWRVASIERASPART